jgi:hypothetical protein
MSDTGLVPVFRTTDAALLELVRSLLRAADLPHVVQGEAGVHLFPLGSAGARTTHRMTGASVLVHAERADEARALLEASPVAEADGGEEVE